MIHITVNGETINFDCDKTVEELLERLDFPPNYLAVELNATVVSRENYSTTVIRDGDEIEVVTLVGGG